MREETSAVFRWLAYATLALLLWQSGDGAYAQAAVPMNRPASAEALLEGQPDALIEELITAVARAGTGDRHRKPALC